MPGRRGYRTVTVRLVSSELTLRGGQRLIHAVRALTDDMSLYEGVKFAQILEAVYVQGRKDGARAAFEEIDRGLRSAMQAIPHKNPGRPRRRRAT